MYTINFNLMHIHKYSLTELESMFPFEREVYLTLLNQHLEKEKDRIEKERQAKDAEIKRIMATQRKRR